MAYPYSVSDYRPEFRAFFEAVNKAWIERYFTLEPVDRAVLEDPETHLLKPGGEILFLLNDDQPVGTVALRPVADGFELTKMAVATDFMGKGLGYFLGTVALDRARRRGARKVVLYTNSSLRPAIHIYEKLGFYNIPVDARYARSDVKMQYDFIDAGVEVGIRLAERADVPELAAVAREIFLDTFRIYNELSDLYAYMDVSLCEASFARELEVPEAELFVITHHGIQGFARIRKSEPQKGFGVTNPWEIERFYIHRHYHGTRAATNLMGHCLSRIRSHGATGVWLGVWDKNPRAIRFYEKYGFRHFGEHPFVLGTDHQTDQMYGLVL